MTRVEEHEEIIGMIAQYADEAATSKDMSKDAKEVYLELN